MTVSYMTELWLCDVCLLVETTKFVHLYFNTLFDIKYE